MVMHVSPIQWGKKRANLICSIFMSFSPMELIFIGWLSDIMEFLLVLGNFDFRPANEIFQKNVNSQLFKKCVFGGYDFENWVWEKLVL